MIMEAFFKVYLISNEKGYFRIYEKICSMISTSSKISELRKFVFEMKFFWDKYE